MTPAEIRALSAESIASLHEVAGKLAELSALLDEDEARRGHVMTARDDKIRQIVAELDVQVAEVEANIAVLKALLAEGEVPGDEDPS